MNVTPPGERNECYTSAGLCWNQWRGYCSWCWNGTQSSEEAGSTPTTPNPSALKCWNRYWAWRLVRIFMSFMSMLVIIRASSFFVVMAYRLLCLAGLRCHPCTLFFFSPISPSFSHRLSIYLTWPRPRSTPSSWPQTRVSTAYRSVSRLRPRSSWFTRSCCRRQGCHWTPGSRPPSVF